MAAWREYDLSQANVQVQLELWRADHFGGGDDAIGTGLIRDLFALARHMAQNDGQLPLHITFDDHKRHDLDTLAREHYDADLGVKQTAPRLLKEYDRKDRQWNAFYPNVPTFKSAYDGCLNRIALILTANPPGVKTTGVSYPEATPDREPSEETKRQIKIRDGRVCLCCGCSSPLEVDHIDSFYAGGSNDPDNLQTLCKYCNKAKNTVKIDFRNSVSPLKEPLRAIPVYALPSDDGARDPTQWEFDVRACFNLFYRAAAVDAVEIGQRGERFHQWHVTLHPGNDPTWLEPYLGYFIECVRKKRHGAGLTPAPQEIILQADEE